MQIKPVNQQIILKMAKLDEVVKNGIIIPANVQEKPHQGIVYLSDHKEYLPGDVVLYRKYSGFEFKLAKEEYLVIEAADVLVKLIEDDSAAEIILK